MEIVNKCMDCGKTIGKNEYQYVYVALLGRKCHIKHLSDFMGMPESEIEEINKIADRWEDSRK